VLEQTLELIKLRNFLELILMWVIAKLRNIFLNVFGVVELFFNPNLEFSIGDQYRSTTYMDQYLSFVIKFILSVNVLYKSRNGTP